MSIIKTMLRSFLCFAISLSAINATYAKLYRWSSEADFPEKFELKPGDHVVIADGEYRDIEVEFRGGGSVENPAYVYAENLGAVKFVGSATLSLKGSYITLAGLVFDGRPEDFDPTAAKQIEGNDVGPLHDPAALGGPARYDGVVRFLANTRGCRLSNCRFINFDRNYTDYEKGMNYVMVRGFEQEIDHCSFEHKRSMNATIFVKPDPGKEPGPEVQRNHRFHHNYFGERNYVGQNGWETIRISDSSKQEYEIALKVDRNYFYRSIVNPGSLAKEKEIISNKSRKNEYTNNVFEECDGQITLRHGRDCLVENNWFLGKGSKGASGVRVIGTGHVIRNNVFDDLDGWEYAATFTLMQGGYGIVNNQYEGVENILIEGNVFRNCRQPLNLGFSTNRGEDYDDQPRNISMRNNRIISSETDYTIFTATADITTSGIWEGNEYYHTSSREHNGDVPPKGWTENEALELELGTPPVSREDVGPSYYGGPQGTFVAPSSL